MTETTTLAAVVPYIPATLVRQLARQRDTTLPPIEPFHSAVLFLDIAGFTPMVVAMSAAGPRGIDTLQQFLASYFTEMIDVLEGFGGVVYQFAGDAILCCFDRSPEETDAAVALRSASCALHIQERLRRFTSVELLGQTFQVSSKIGLGFGHAHRILLGHPGPFTHPMILGAPVEAAVQAEKHAAGGEVIASPELWQLLGAAATGTPRKDDYQLDSVAISEPTPARARWQFPLTDFDDEIVRKCAPLIPPALFKKIATGHQDFIADLRGITCVFIRFEGLDYHGDVEDFVARVNLFFEFVERESSHHGGVLMQTDFTDKGNVFFVLFGAPTAQEHNELLAVRFARKLQSERSRFLFIDELEIGIATGQAFCGNLGSPLRKGYSTLGEVVNLAARLMTYRKESGIYLEGGTERKIRSHFTTELIAEAQLKGVSRPVPVYRITGERQVLRSLFVEGKGEIIGRKEELEALHGYAREALDGAGQVCVVSGEAGIGKSRTAGKLMEEARAYDIQALYGICYSYEMFTPFYPWKELLVHFFQLFENDPLEVQLDKLHRALGEIEDAGPEWVPVVAGIIGLPVEEDPLTRGLDARRKNQKVFHIILQLLGRRTEKTPLLLFFEDLHWADRISVDLIEYLAPRVSGMRIMVLCTMRPSEHLSALDVLPNFHRVELGHLSPAETREFLRKRLRLDPPSPALEELILTKVYGNPFYIESIVDSLAEQGHLRSLPGGNFQLVRSLEEITVPDSIQDVILGRIDRLDETSKTVLRVASVIGRVFTLEALSVLMPETISPDSLRQAITTLNTLGLTLLELEEPLTCIFKHIVIRDVAYNTLLVSGREDLHRRLARHLETKAAQNPAASAGILAYHYLAGSDEQKGLYYTLLAARSAKEQYANKDAIHHYQRGLAIIERAAFLPPDEQRARLRKAKQELGETLLQAGSYDEAIALFGECLGYDPSPSEQAEIHVGLGRAYQEKGESSRAIDELETSLQLLGRRAPKSRLGVALGVVGQLMLYGVRLLFPWILRPIPEARLPGYLKQLATLISLIRIYYFVDINKLTWATLTAANMASRSPSVYGASMASIYVGTLYFGAGLLGRSARHITRGLELARQCRDSVAEGIAISRLGIQASFCNDLTPALARLEQAVNMFHQVGEMWEAQTSLMMLATTHFMRSDFAAAEPIYVRMGAIGQKLNALMHQAWSHSWAPFCRYLRGQASAAEVRPELEQGHALSVEVGDLANQCASLNHLCNVAVREGEVEEAARAAVRAFDAIWRYQVMVPFLQHGLIDAAEAALFALEGGATSVGRGRLRRIVRLSLVKARFIGRMYPYLRGPTLRIAARFAALSKGAATAEPLFERALACLDATPNRWETAVAYLDAAQALPHRSAAWLARAREIFQAIDAQVELRRVERLERSLPQPSASERMLPPATSAAPPRR